MNSRISALVQVLKTCLFVGLLGTVGMSLSGCRQKVDKPEPEPSGSGKIHKLAPGPNVQEEAQTALIHAKPGDTIEFTAGNYQFTRGLSLAVENVTIRGQGMDKTILSFKNQNAGSEGLLVTRDKFVLQDLTVDDAKGDAVKVSNADGVVFRRVRTRWTGGEKETNGAYGLYPVLCKNVLIDECEAYGASDAGIYVGQSQHVIVRKCRAERNVAGIEIENSSDVDVHENLTTNNTGGLLVFDLPGLEVKNGKRIRVFNNNIRDNNHPNFAPKGNIVATVAQGTGMMVMATDQVEVFGNTLSGNKTHNLAIVSFFITGRPIPDKQYDPIPEGIFIHDNTFSGGGDEPGGEMGPVLQGLLGAPLPDILYDGIIVPERLKDGKVPTPFGVYLQNNQQKKGPATFANLSWGEMPNLAQLKSDEERLAALKAHSAKVIRDAQRYQGTLPALPPVKLTGIE